MKNFPWIFQPAVVDLSSQRLVLLWDRSIFAIFKMHLRVSALTIFRETPLNYTTLGYYKLVEYQLLYSLLHHLPWLANMVEKSKIYVIMGYVDFCNLRNACPPQCCGHFLRNPTQLHSSRILHTGTTSALILISIALTMTCKDCRKIEISKSRKRRFFQFSKFVSA